MRGFVVLTAALVALCLCAAGSAADRLTLAAATGVGSNHDLGRTYAFVAPVLQYNGWWASPRLDLATYLQNRQRPQGSLTFGVNQTRWLGTFEGFWMSDRRVLSGDLNYRVSQNVMLGVYTDKNNVSPQVVIGRVCAFRIEDRNLHTVIEFR